MGSGMRRRLSLGACAAAAASFLIVWPTLPVAARAPVSNVAQLAAAAMATLAAVLAARRTTGRERLAWSLLAAGCLSWALGGAVWAWDAVVWQRAPVSPSLLDTAFLLFAPLAAAAVVVFPVDGARLPRSSHVRLVLDALIIAGTLFFLLWVALLGSTVRAVSGRLTTAEVVVGTSYVALDLLLVSVVVFGASRGRAGASRALAMLGLGVAAIASADVSSVYLTARGMYHSGGAFDLAWVVGFVIVAASTTVGAGRVRWVSGKVPVWALAALPYALAVLMVLANLELQLQRGHDTVMTAVTSVVMLLVLMRQMLTLSERTALQRELSHLAYHDPLTGLANRGLFSERLEHALAVAARGRRPVSVAFVDLDDFKTLNDAHGHEAGDELLRTLADRMSAALRQGDTLARLGGDEFALLLEDTDSPAALLAVSRLVRDIGEPLTVAGTTVVTPRASIGVATTTGTDTASTLLAHADIAMYAAKASGKAAVRAFEPAMLAQVTARSQLVADLESALGDNQLTVHYQPVVNALVGEVEAVEALLRWRHPERGLLAAADFVPLAEEAGLLPAMGRWTMDRALRDLATINRGRVPGQAPLWVGVNLSRAQLSDPRLADDVREAMDRAAAQPVDLVLEVAETVLVADAGAATRALRPLRESGVRIAVDDFGTGHSALRSLRTLPVDMLKIDAGVLDALGSGDERDGFLVAAVVGLATSLGLQTVVEGVETVEQASELRRLGCDYLQGYLALPPTPLAGLLAWLADSRPLAERLATRTPTPVPLAR